MSTFLDSDRPAQSPEAPTAAGGPAPARLRVWPVAVMLLLLALCRSTSFFVEEMSFGLFMLSVWGPIILALTTMIWWLFFSRAIWPERWLGLAGLLLIGIGSYVAADKSVHGMGFFFFALPIGLAATHVAWLALSLVRTPLRTWGVLLAAALSFGYWDLVRSDGIWGDFKAALQWRWEPTQEDRFLAGLRSDPSASRTVDSDAAAAEPLGEILWPQFRGAHQDAVVPGVVLDTDWTAHPPQEIWRRPVGPGWSSFSVAGKRLFTQEQRDESEAVLCLNADTGKTLWVRESPARFWESVAGAGPRATPTLNGDRLFVLGATGLLQRLNPLTGDIVWTRDLKQDAHRQPPTWGFSSSPLVVNETVIVYAGGSDDKGVLAYDAETGDPRWSVAAGDHSYSSPQWSQLGGQDQVLMLTNTGLQAIDPASGKQLWNYDWLFQGYRVVQPLVVGGSSVLLGTGMGQGTRRIDLKEGGDRPSIEAHWTSLQMKPDFNDYVAYQGHLYGFDHNIFACIDLETGRRRWKQGRYGTGQVLLLPDAGQLLVLAETGEIVLLAANPDELDEQARWKVLEGKTWNHPALVQSRLYVRNAEQAACFELPLAGKPAAGSQGEAAGEAEDRESDSSDEPR